MLVIRHLATSKHAFTRSAVTIGNFDGVHRGHQEILRRLIAAAREIGGEAVAYTFDPHPMKILRPEAAPPVITPIEKKIKLIRSLGVDVLVCERFTEAFSSQRPEDFVPEVLVERLRTKRLFVGYDYRYGKGRAGDIDLLRELGARWGFTVDVTEALRVGDRIVSSTLIRDVVAEGKIREAAEYLGRYY
ncbi:MAG: hypothetical protein K8I02_01520, partial [Candidatus Methylomirabilis sp.]|nr:hypothetical protein [Deltaproteobacteria bacterium]